MGSGKGKKEMKIEMGWVEVRARESSDKESETECQKKYSTYHSECQRHHQTIPSYVVGEQRGVTRSQPAGNVKKHFSSQFLVVATMEHGSVSSSNRLR